MRIMEKLRTLKKIAAFNTSKWLQRYDRTRTKIADCHGVHEPKLAMPFSFSKAEQRVQRAKERIGFAIKDAVSIAACL